MLVCGNIKPNPKITNRTSEKTHLDEHQDLVDHVAAGVQDVDPVLHVRNEHLVLEQHGQQGFMSFMLGHCEPGMAAGSVDGE